VRIDVHNHVYPRGYVKAITQGSSGESWSIRERPGGVQVLVSRRGYVFGLSEETYEPDLRVHAMEGAGIDVQLLSLSEPWLESLPAREASKWARQTNEALAVFHERYPQRFFPVGSLPLHDVDKALEEFDYALQTMGHVGITLPTAARDDEPISASRFEPLFQRAAQTGTPVFLHPSLPPDAEALSEFRLGLMVGYPSQTLLCVAKLLFGGTLERYPDLKLLLADLGGGAPFLVGRMQRFYESMPECRSQLSKEPREYLKELFYENGSEFYAPSVRCVHALAGAEHLTFGTNYPSPIVHFEKALESVRQLHLPTAEEEQIFWKTAARLFSLKLN
jgi:aminocarboxymuconate-semialdehyde decarboxylase